MRSWAAARLGAVLAAVLALAGACSEAAELDLEQARADIASRLSRSYATEVTVRSCPSEITAERGEDFECTVEVDGQPLEVRVVQRDDQGNLSVEPQAVVIRTRDVSEDLAGRLQERFGRTFLMDCGAPATKVVEPGASFTCHGGDGMTERDVRVTVTDLAGSLSYEIVEPGPASPPAPPAPAPTDT